MIIRVMLGSYMSLSQENQHSAYAKTKVQISFTADQLYKADQRLCFRYTDSTIPLLSKAPSHLLCMYSLVCVRPVRKLHCWFSYDRAYKGDLLFVYTKQEIAQHPSSL